MPVINTTKSKPKLIAVVGPTATGKSDFAVLLAKIFNGEIISADSRQVYKGLDKGTGKITKKEMLGVPHHMLDIASPRSAYDVTKYKLSADKKISEIYKRHKLPFLVGGSGFWIDAVAFNQAFPNVPPNLNLRKKLDKLSASDLFAILQKIDLKRSALIDRHNKRRLVRAIEIVELTKKSSTELLKSDPQYDTLFIGLDQSDSVLFDKIDKRLAKRLRQGLVSEVKNLHANGITWKRLDDLGLEYRYISMFLQGTLTKTEAIAQLKAAIIKYAKRQRTWFKRNEKIIWLDPQKKTTAIKARAAIKKFLGS